MSHQTHGAYDTFINNIRTKSNFVTESSIYLLEKIKNYVHKKKKKKVKVSLSKKKQGPDSFKNFSLKSYLRYLEDRKSGV
jgi:hypothetical protein